MYSVRRLDWKNIIKDICSGRNPHSAWHGYISVTHLWIITAIMFCYNLITIINTPWFVLCLLSRYNDLNYKHILWSEFQNNGIDTIKNNTIKINKKY